MENFWNTLTADFASFSIKQAVTAFMILFVSVDVIGAIPIVLSLKDKGQIFNAEKVGLLSGLMFLFFLFLGEPMLGFFGVDVSSFAIAGSIVLFVLAVEMIFGVQVFKDDNPSGGDANVVPLVFPLFAGAASFTAILTLKSNDYSMLYMIISVVLNTLCVYLVLRFISVLERILGKGGVYILRKFFGVILLAISVKFFIENLMKLL